MADGFWGLSNPAKLMIISLDRQSADSSQQPVLPNSLCALSDATSVLPKRAHVHAGLRVSGFA